VKSQLSIKEFVFAIADNCLHIYRACSVYIILFRIGGCGVCDIKIRYCIYLNKSEFCASGSKMAAVKKVRSIAFSYFIVLIFVT
jgi:hypothetical protein